MAPRIGPRTAVIATATVVAHAKRAVAIAGGRRAAATALKNGGNTAVMTVDWNAELAQSYIAHARSSGRFKPRRSSRLMSEGPPRDPFPQQRIDHLVSRPLLHEHVLIGQPSQRLLNTRGGAEPMTFTRLGRVDFSAALEHDGAQRRALVERHPLPERLEQCLLFRKQSRQ